MITVAMLAALGRQEELAGHLRGALNAGLTKEELIEVLMQAGVYAGVPMGVAALNTAGLGTRDRVTAPRNRRGVLLLGRAEHQRDARGTFHHFDEITDVVPAEALRLGVHQHLVDG